MKEIAIFEIATDNQGNIWLVPCDRILKFNGTNWIDYGSSSELVGRYFVTAIVIDAQDNKWFGTSEGVTKFDGSSWITYTTSNGLASNSVRAIAINAQGNIWLGTGEGITKISYEKQPENQDNE